MSLSDCRPLIEVLSEVPDFRKPQGKRHPLPAILALACAATLCGYKSYGAMAQWGRNYGSDLAQALGFPGGRTPAVGTLHTVLSGLDRRALEEALSGWAECVLAHLPRRAAAQASALQAVALDGKTLRGSKARGACDAHLLSAVSHGLGLTLWQEAVSDKTNEITAAQAVLSSLVLEGRVVTMDALLTQKAVARTVVERGGQFVMTVKDNHPLLRKKIERFFECPGLFVSPPLPLGPTLHTAHTRDKGHGRVEGAGSRPAATYPTATWTFRTSVRSFG